MNKGGKKKLDINDVAISVDVDSEVIEGVNYCITR